MDVGARNAIRNFWKSKNNKQENMRNNMNEENIKQTLKLFTKNTSVNGYIESGSYDIINFKNEYNISDYYIVEVLRHLIEHDEIKELHVNYDKKDGHILYYKFK